MFKKQTKIYRAGTVVNVSIISTSGRPVNHTSNLTAPSGSVTADYENTVNVIIDAYSDWKMIRIFPTGSVVVERRVDSELLVEKEAAHA